MMRLMAVTRFALAALLLASTAACASGEAPGRSVVAATDPPSSLDLTHAVVLNDGERLDPPPSGARPLLTALAAWEAFAARNHARQNRHSLPAGARAYLASFTSSGDAEPTLVYGVRLPGCRPVYTLRAPTPYPQTCVGWEILDANTAADLDLAWEGLPSG